MSLDLVHMLESESGRGWDYDKRFYEAETAMQLGIPFDKTWYQIPRSSREQMIATRLARNAVNNFQTKQAMAKT